jgi:hypothetical protein
MTQLSTSHATHQQRFVSKQLHYANVKLFVAPQKFPQLPRGHRRVHHVTPELRHHQHRDDGGKVDESERIWLLLCGRQKSSTRYHDKTVGLKTFECLHDVGNGNHTVISDRLIGLEIGDCSHVVTHIEQALDHRETDCIVRLHRDRKDGKDVEAIRGIYEKYSEKN